MSSWAQERLGRLLFPTTLCDAATVTAAEAVLASRGLPEDLRNAVAEQAAIIREVIAAHAAAASITGDGATGSARR